MSNSGIRVIPTEVTVKAYELPEITLLVQADPNAALGEYRIIVTGTPADGKPTSVTFSVKVPRQNDSGK